MPTATSEDTEITLGTGKMLALFFGLVALCAVFFGFGFSLGKNSALKPSAAETSLPAPAPAVILRPSAVKTETTLASSADTSNAVPDKAPDTQTGAGATTAATDPSASAADPKSSAADPIPPPVLNGYYVQVAAVSKPEDADALVDALKKKQYPAFAATTAADQLVHVQLGPYGDIKDAEATRAKLVSDGYNPILKK